MTFEETKDLLIDIKNAKQRALNIQARIASLGGMHRSLKSIDYSKPRVQGGKQFTMQNILDRLNLEISKLNDALEMAFALEDKVAAAVALLNPIEQDIIIGCYMDCKYHWQLARELGYCDKQIKRLKSRAIEKMSDIL